MKIAFAVLLAGIAAGCSPTRPAEAPGYHGSMPSAAGLEAIRRLHGKTLPSSPRALGGGSWQILKLAVIPPCPCPTAADRIKRPVVLIEGAGRRACLPMECDGDAADLYRRVTGSSHESLSGELSARYAAVWK